MTDRNRIYILANPASEEGEVQSICDDLTSGFAQEGIAAEVDIHLDRVVVILSDHNPVAQCNQIIVDLGYDIEDRWVCGPPSGKMLSVNLEYSDEGQIVSADIDEGLLLDALSGVGHDRISARTAAAITAFAGGNEFTWGYGPMSGNLQVQDIMSRVEFWSAEEALRWSPKGWEEGEDLVRFRFTPEAELAETGARVAVCPDLAVSWEVPARLLSDFDPDSEASRNWLMRQPVTPEKARAWAELAPFSLEIDNPELLPRAPSDGPGF